MGADDVRPIRLVLIDDREVARDQAASRLRQHPLLEIIGAVAGFAGALHLVLDLRPDAVLVATRPPDRGGLDAIRLLSALDGASRPAIIAYLEILHCDGWPAARAAGADDLLLTGMDPESMARELQRITSGVCRGAATSDS